MEGWVSLYRKFMNWQWYKNSNVKAVFIHLLLCANHKEEMVGKRVINRGQLITSRESLSKGTGLSEQQIRTCLNKLESTNEIVIERTNKYSIITILKYDIYQKNFDEISTSKIANKSTNKNEDISTSKNDMKSTNKNAPEIIENSKLQECKESKSTNKKSTKSTNKNEDISTSTSTGKSTTNNNINNIYNNNLTKLNYIFNLIINNNSENLKIEKNKWNGFKLWLKRLDLDANENFMNCLSVEKQLEYKIILPALLQLYTNSYQVYIGKLTREDIFHKILKAKEHRGKLETLNDEQIKEFASYYLKCLQNFIDGSDKNAKN